MSVLLIKVINFIRTYSLFLFLILLLLMYMYKIHLIKESKKAINNKSELVIYIN